MPSRHGWQLRFDLEMKTRETCVCARPRAVVSCCTGNPRTNCELLDKRPAFATCKVNGAVPRNSLAVDRGLDSWLVTAKVRDEGPAHNMPRCSGRVRGANQQVEQALPLTKAGIGWTSKGLHKRSAGIERGELNTAGFHMCLRKLQAYRNSNGELHKSHASH